MENYINWRKKRKIIQAAIAAADSFIYYLDSIYDTTKAAEITRLADQYEIEFYQQKLREDIKLRSYHFCCYLLLEERFLFGL